MRLADRWAVLVLGVLVAGVAPPVTRPAATRPVVVPFELLRSGHIAVRAKVNGHGPYRFVFDTGAPTLLIGERAAKDSGVLPPKFHRPWFTVMGNLGPHTVSSLDVGGARVAGLSAQVWDHPTVALLAEGEGPLDGLIGFPFFARFELTVDYRTKTLSLTPTAYVPEDVEEKLRTVLTSDPPVIAPAASLGIRVAKDGRDTAAGVVVVDVHPGTAAADAGVLIGDRLLTLDGRWTDAVDDVYTAAANLDPTTAADVPATLSRDGRLIAVRMAVRHGI